MDVFYITLLTIFAAGVGTLTGFGTSTIMVPTLLIFFPLPQTLLLVGIIHWFGNIWKISLFREGLRMPLLLAFGIPGVVATYLGARIVFTIPQTFLSQVLGAFLIGYVLFIFFKPSFKFAQKTTTAVAGGSLSGFFAGIFGVGGAVRSVFLSAFDLPKAVYISTAGVIGLAVDSTRVATYVSEGVALEGALLLGLVLFIPASFLGAFLAKRVVEKIPQEKFRLVVVAFLLIVGIKLLLFP